MHTHTLSASNIHLDELMSDAIVAAGERQYLAEPTVRWLPIDVKFNCGAHFARKISGEIPSSDFNTRDLLDVVAARKRPQ